MIKYLAVFIVPIGYFLAIWFIPWENYFSLGSFSSSLTFDIVFILSFYTYFGTHNILGKFQLKKIGIYSALVLILATLCIGTSNAVGLNSPFRYLDYVFIKLLIVAPILEEFVFRGVFIELGERVKLNRQVSSIINAFLFSLSHLPALWFLEDEFHGFIAFQLVYTVALGYICAAARFKTKGVAVPVLLHFLFNLVFYIAILKKFL